MMTVHESAREVPVTEDVDVMVAGGGPAGVMAAVAAARTGASVRLIEAHGALGGIWTTGLLPHIIEPHQPGLLRELIERLRHRGAHGVGSVITERDFDVETLKVVLDEFCSEAGVRTRCYTRVCAASVQEGRLDAVLTESKSGREAWRAKVFVDCTGDGDLGAQAGCRFEIGQPGTGLCQPMSVMALLAGYGTSDQPPFNIREWGRNKDWIKAEMEAVGVSPSYSRPTMFLIDEGWVNMMANHEYGYRGPDAQKLTDASMAGRAENLRIVAALRARGGRWKNLRMAATSAQIGVRESRRIHGLYTVTRQDLERGSRFEDAVCRVTFCVDIHALDPSRGKGIDASGVHVRPYDIPLRALIAADVEGLMMAGRCISGDFVAHSSYRVSGDAAALGEAAGVAAAIAARSKIVPSRVPYAEIRKFLPELPA